MNKLSSALLSHIDSILDLDDNNKIVLIETSEIIGIDKHIYNANIYCVDNDNNIIWQVDSSQGLKDRDPFVEITREENGIAARRFFGTLCIIDPKTGISKKVGWSK